MEIVFDRYEPLAGALHRDLATGHDVEIAVHDVPDEAWRDCWRARAESSPSLVDFGEAGSNRVFEVRRSGPHAIEIRAARGAPVGAGADDACDARAGLVSSPLRQDAALRFARETGRIAVAEHVDPRSLPEDVRGGGFVILGETRELRARWSAALAAAGSRRHFYIRSKPRAFTVRERALVYGVGFNGGFSPAANRVLCRARDQLSRGRLACAGRLAARAARLSGASDPTASDALTIKARAARLRGRSEDAYRLLLDALERRPALATAGLLIEAAEASTDCGRLERGEAFARAAIDAALTDEARHRARQALDRARVWRGEPVDTEPWTARAAWHESGTEPAWRGAAGYPHAAHGPLARWEELCDRLERAIWHGERRTRIALARRLRDRRDELPPLLRARADWLADRAPLRARRLGAHGILRTGKTGGVMEVFERMSELLRVAEDADGDRALQASASRLRGATRARTVAIHAAGRPLPIAGDGIGWNAASELAERFAMAIQPAVLERLDAGARAAISLKAAGAPIGAVVVAWPSHTSVDERQVRLLLESAALVIAPLLRGWIADAESVRRDDMPEIVGTSAAIEAVRDAIRRVARVPFPVLIEGESGAGKELVARAVHRLSNRSSKPFRALNCAAMAEDLVEAELFGHAQGAFTGASGARAGLFEDADRGTLFLDEVTELSARAQAKLLRVLQEGEVRRVGETTARRVDVRIVAATNGSIQEAVGARAFRADLSFRLDVLRIDVPPLRRRPEDIALLCAHFWRDAAARAGTAATLSVDAVGRLAAYDWPGNVRELQNVMAALAVAAPRRGKVTCAHLPARIGGGVPPSLTLHQARAALERDLVQGALARSGGRQAKAAAELGVTRQGLAKLMRRLGLPAA